MKFSTITTDEKWLQEHGQIAKAICTGKPKEKMQSLPRELQLIVHHLCHIPL